jgi:hypothetical protein
MFKSLRVRPLGSFWQKGETGCTDCQSATTRTGECARFFDVERTYVDALRSVQFARTQPQLACSDVVRLCPVKNREFTGRSPEDPDKIGVFRKTSRWITGPGTESITGKNRRQNRRSARASADFFAAGSDRNCIGRSISSDAGSKNFAGGWASH